MSWLGWVLRRKDRSARALHSNLLPKDPNDERNCFLEIRAGAGGDEAGIFAGNLFRMYFKFVEKKGWRIEVMSCNESEHKSRLFMIFDGIATTILEKQETLGKF